MRQPAHLSTSQHRQSSLRSSEEHLKSSRASSQQLSAEGTSAHDLRGAWPRVIQQGAEEESHLSSSSPPALFCLAPSLQREVIPCTVPSIPVCRHQDSTLLYLQDPFCSSAQEKEEPSSDLCCMPSCMDLYSYLASSTYD